MNSISSYKSFKYLIILMYGAKNSAKLSWTWVSESLMDTLSGKGSFTDTKLLEQKETTGDASDYLWYMTR